MTEQKQDKARKSFSNGNGPQQDGPQMEGWVISSAHWWLYA